MYAVIAQGGKQFKVSEGDVIEVEKIDGEIGAKVEMEVLMTSDGGNVLVGKDAGAKVTGEIVKQGRGRKIVVFKYKAKKNERTRKGHRQAFTKVKIVSIG